MRRTVVVSALSVGTIPSDIEDGALDGYPYGLLGIGTCARARVSLNVSKSSECGMCVFLLHTVGLFQLFVGDGVIFGRSDLDGRLGGKALALFEMRTRGHEGIGHAGGS